MEEGLKGARERTPYIGRERERSLVIEDLGRGAGLLTLTGPSGIGKTRLATQVMAQVAASYEDAGGAWLCSLNACTSAVDVEAAVARTLGIPKQEGETLARVIANRSRMLLILDNLDAVAEEVGPVIDGWLDRCPSLQLITTSIVPIRVAGAVQVELGPLEEADAVALYLDRAHRAWAGRTFTETEAPAVSELVGRLDRIPLAIELAAARIRVLPPRTLLARFGERFELLRSGAPGRHGSLEEALTLTWELLSPREQLVLSRASVFEGGFTHEAAQAVLDEEASNVEMLDLLDGLRSKALLQLGETEPPRFSLFESIRDFARRALRASGQEEASVRKHARYFVELGEQHGQALEGPGVLASIRWLRAERENLIAAHQRSLETDPALAAKTGLALAPLLALEGHSSTELRLLETTLQAARASGSPSLLMQAIANEAMAILAQGKIDEALSSLDEALSLARSSGDRVAEGLLLVRSATVKLRRGKLDVVLEDLDRAIRIGDQERAPLVEGAALMGRATVTTRRDLLASNDYFDRALTILRTHGFVEREAHALTWAAGSWCSQGRFREARRALHDALVTFRLMGHRFAEANVLLFLGGVELAAGRLDAARRYSLQSLELQRGIGNRRGEGSVKANLGLIALEQGELEPAETWLLDAVGILAEAGDRQFHAITLPFLAVLEARVGRPADARRSLDEAKAFFRSVDDPANLALLEVFEGILALAAARELPKTEVEEIQRLVQGARAQRAATTAAQLGTAECKFEAIRLLEQELARWDEEPLETGEASGEAPAAGLRIGEDGAWFETPGGERVNMRRRLALRRMLEALAKARLESPGEGLSAHRLFEIGWSGEQIDSDAAVRRVYFGIWTLRELGLSKLLLNQTDGYLLDPHVPLDRDR